MHINLGPSPVVVGILGLAWLAGYYGANPSISYALLFFAGVLTGALVVRGWD